MSPIRNFLRQGGSELVRKALTSATGSGEALIPQHLEKLITNTVIRLIPEFLFMEPEFGHQKKHEFNQITSLGTGGGAMGESAVTATTNSTYNRTFVNLKVVRRKGLVSDFLQESSADFADALAVEIENQSRQQAYALNLYNMYGNEKANPYEYTGRDTYIRTNRSQAGFSSGVATVPTSFKPLDDMFSSSNRAGGFNHKRAYIMSPEMHMKFNQLATQTRILQPTSGRITQVDLGYGFIVDAYLGIPIIESTMVGGAFSGTMTTVTAASGGTTGGSFSDGTYYFRVEKVTPNGISQASAQSSVTLAGGTATQKIALTWAADADAIQYRIHYSATTGLTAMTLIDVVAGNAYDSAGTVGAATTGATILAGTATTNVTNTASATDSFSANMSADIPLTASGGYNAESIYLIDYDRIQGLGKFPYTNNGSQGQGIISMRPLYNNDAGIPFLIYTHGAIAPSFESTSCVSRGWRVA
jgi:hypothetical protein